MDAFVPGTRMPHIADLYAVMAREAADAGRWPTWQELSPARRRWWSRMVAGRLKVLGYEVRGVQDERRP